ncbi:MAG: hypothetical protein II899_03950 [Bacteroidales bacterium]|nr:hypothetical protein [Bacteroidales bacterium]
MKKKELLLPIAWTRQTFDLQEADVKPLLEPAEQLVTKITSLVQQEIQ